MWHISSVSAHRAQQLWPHKNTTSLFRSMQMPQLCTSSNSIILFSKYFTRSSEVGSRGARWFTLGTSLPLWVRRWSIGWAQDKHFFIRTEHSPHAIWCEHGSKITSASTSLHTMHSLGCVELIWLMIFAPSLAIFGLSFAPSFAIFGLSLEELALLFDVDAPSFCLCATAVVPLADCDSSWFIFFGKLRFMDSSSPLALSGEAFSSRCRRAGVGGFDWLDVPGTASSKTENKLLLPFSDIFSACIFE